MRASRASVYLLALAAAIIVLSASVAPQWASGNIVASAAHITPTTHHDGCFDHNGFKVTPCKLTFSSSNPGPFTVSIYKKNDNKKGAYTEYDDCAGIATVVSQDSSNQVYAVTAGSVAGSCTAWFTFIHHHRQLSWGNLAITSSL